MLNLPRSRALSRHFTIVRAIAIMVAMVGCGGAIAGSGSGDGGNSDPTDVCPPHDDLVSGAAVGTACFGEGVSCADALCDPCVNTCAQLSCTKGHWTPTRGIVSCGADASASARDSGADAMTCTQVDTKGYDHTCNQDVDCAPVSEGNICNTGSCLCPTDALNKGSNADVEYASMVDQVMHDEGFPKPSCNCPTFGEPKCVQGICHMCGGASPACPDGG